jgi:3-methyladenine DNA glycosylase AlkD
MATIPQRVVRRLRRDAEPGRAANVARFFKTGPGEYGEGDVFIGLRVPQIRAAAREFESITIEETGELLDCAEHEARLLALILLVKKYAKGREAEREKIYRLYLGRTSRINNWDLVDSSAPYIVGPHLQARGRPFLRELARSPSLWDRRIAILATFHYIKAGDFDDALAIGRMLLTDREDLIHKAVGWMLREVGKRDRRTLEKFLETHAGAIPRTALRYAIERFPDGLRRRYLSM